MTSSLLAYQNGEGLVLCQLSPTKGEDGRCKEEEDRRQKMNRDRDRPVIYQIGEGNFSPSKKGHANRISCSIGFSNIEVVRFNKYTEKCATFSYCKGIKVL